MAKKLAKGELNVSQEIRDALAKFGKNATHTEIGEYLTKKFPSNPKIAKSVSSKIWYQTVYAQRRKLSRGKKIASRKLMRAAIRSGSENGVTQEAAMMFALKAGGIDNAIAALKELSEKLKG
jgi:predicted DNA-binding protein (UPF0278 family)